MQQQRESLAYWTTLMATYTRHGQALEAMQLFQVMFNGQYMSPDTFVFATVLRACTKNKDLIYGKALHCQIIKLGMEVDVFVTNALVTMYANCNCLESSFRVFNGIQCPDLVSWSSIIQGCVQSGYESDGLSLFCEMQRNGIRPDVLVFGIVMSACANLGCFGFGTQIHCFILKMGFDSFLFLENGLIDFYAKCGFLSDSYKIFSGISLKSMVSWNTIIAGFVHNCGNEDALMLFHQLQRIKREKGGDNGELVLDEFTLTSVLRAITGLGALRNGREVHGYLIRAGCKISNFVFSGLLDMYVKCSIGAGNEPLRLFIQFQLSGMKPDEFAISSILKFCASDLALEQGKMIHSYIIKHEKIQSDIYAISSLIDMYAKCGIIDAAYWVFSGIKKPGVVPWSSIISGFSQNDQWKMCLQLFRKMQYESVKPNEYTFTAIVMACIAVGDLRKGKELHCNIIRTGYGSEVPVINTLINLYCEFGLLEQALNLCDSIPSSKILWGYLIQACSRTGDHERILELFKKVHQSSANLDHNTSCYVIESCSNQSLLVIGEQTHAYFIKKGMDLEPKVGAPLINMYSSCGRIKEATNIFNEMPERSSMAWASMVSAIMEHGQPINALYLFKRMRCLNKSPDSQTFLSLLKACSQLGFVREAFKFLGLMHQEYGLSPSREHYASMIEVLGLAGMFDEAEEFIHGDIPFEPDELVWRALFYSSRIKGNMHFAKYAAEKLVELDPKDYASTSLLEQVLITSGRWEDASKLRNGSKLERETHSWIEVRSTIHEFGSNQTVTEEIHEKLGQLEREMDELGYVADKNHWLHDSEEVGCGVSLYHTEMMALAFGLVHLAPKTPIRVFKSVRMCGDCHSVFKFLSSFLGRDMLVKDTGRFHHFKDGKCCCNDTW
ncbi:hypothetical protein AMTR_s00040p00174700 [Amborella trichopoda]|uniref:DYW domain-containing protein n=2 Tax=Amborella trichopoda TaxID=13333 RepID=W1PZS9_AMBTC|nr:hypothetical protein AMTR_s00040p00174700 [Amborella trichopoda]